jgi:predicted metal-dependent hydrolase
MQHSDLPLYTIKPSKRARRLALRLDPLERIFHLTVPLRCPLERAYEFADTHEEWMKKALSELPEPQPFIHGTVLPVLGQNITLDISHDPSVKITSIKEEGDRLYITSNLEDPGIRIERFLKKKAKEILHLKSKEKSLTINKKIENVSVRDTKSRWGSCSSDKNLSYSWRLIFAPPHALDYVVAHEVAHLKHLDHSAKFWALCRSLSDNFVEGQFWMQNHGHELMRYGAAKRSTPPQE